MPSYVAWLDASAEAQRRARETLARHRAAAGRHELGLGPLWDAFADAMFPGISVGQTRARYFLLVPWLFRYGEEHHRLEGSQLARWAQDRWTAESTAYWSGLIRYGILTHDVGADQLRRQRPVRRDDDAEPSARPVTNWIATLPAAPAGFPATAPESLALQRPEAEWLRDRVLAAVPGTVLAHIMRTVDRVDPASFAPWRDGTDAAATGAPREWLADARRYAVATHGASLLVDLLVAERYERAGLRRVHSPVEQARECLHEWADEVAELPSWHRRPLWARLRTVDPRLSASTCSFVDAWLEAIGERIDPDSPILRDLVAHRERRVMRAQSRLVNDRLLRTWPGVAGTAMPTFRWAQVRTMARDIADALA